MQTKEKRLIQIVLYFFLYFVCFGPPFEFWRRFTRWSSVAIRRRGTSRRWICHSSEIDEWDSRNSRFNLVWMKSVRAEIHFKWTHSTGILKDWLSKIQQNVINSIQFQYVEEEYLEDKVVIYQWWIHERVEIDFLKALPEAFEGSFRDFFFFVFFVFKPFQLVRMKSVGLEIHFKWNFEALTQLNSVKVSQRGTSRRQFIYQRWIHERVEIDLLKEQPEASEGSFRVFFF